MIVVQHLSLLINILPHYVEYMLMCFVFLYCLYRYSLKLVHLIFYTVFSWYLFKLFTELTTVIGSKQQSCWINHSIPALVSSFFF